MRFLDGAAGAASTVLSKFTGQELLDEIADFLYLLKHMYEPLIDRTRGFEELLRADSTRFCVVTSPAPGPLREARFFHEELTQRELPVGALVVNRVLPPAGDDALALGQDGVAEVLRRGGIAEELRSDLAAAACRALRQHEALAERDAHALEGLLADAAQGVAVVRVPQLAHDVHDAERLGELLPHLVGEL
jgi:anion-transporting  ArsA/GET3 family ATPase